MISVSNVVLEKGAYFVSKKGAGSVLEKSGEFVLEMCRKGEKVNYGPGARMGITFKLSTIKNLQKQFAPCFLSISVLEVTVMEQSISS